MGGCMSIMGSSDNIGKFEAGVRYAGYPAHGAFRVVDTYTGDYKRSHRHASRGTRTHQRFQNHGDSYYASGRHRNYGRSGRHSYH